MTRFEIDRLEEVFQYLESELEHRYADLIKNGTSDQKRATERKIKRVLVDYDDVKRTLHKFGFFTEDENNATYNEKYFSDPTIDHVYTFRVLWSGFVGSEGIDGENEEKFIQNGHTKEEAQHFLESHLLFEHCTDKNFQIKEITLLYQNI